MNSSPQLKLRDIALPQEIGFEIAYGWIALVILILILVFISIIYLRKIKRNPKNLALKELDLIKTRFNEDKDYHKLARECNLLLRRYVMQKYNITIKDEEKWLEFLSKNLILTEDIKIIFSEKIYQKKFTFNDDDLLNYCDAWIKNNNV